MPENNAASVGAVSKFNEGMLQMSRISKLQDRINEANLQPLNLFIAEDTHQLLYGFQIIFNSLNSLFAEASSKLSDKELTDTKAMKNKIDNLFITNPVFELKVNEPAGHTLKKVPNEKNWMLIKGKLFEYELAIRKLLEKHKLTSPAGDRPEEAGYK